MNEENLNYKNQIELKKEQKKMHNKRTKSLIIKVSFFAMLLIVSTYAWFTSQKDITLSNIRGTVEVVENMEISLDAKTWYQRIDLSDAVNTFAEAQESRDESLGELSSDTKSTAFAILPEQLFPVSGIGEIGSSLMPLYDGEATSTSLSGILKCEEEKVNLLGQDEVVDNGYFAFDIYIKNTSRDSEIDVLQLNLNSSVQVLTETINKTITDVLGNEVNRSYYGNEASGLQNAVRVALAKYDGEVNSTSTQKQILDSTKSATITDIAIWEPNAYDHVESIVANNNKLINGTNTNKIEFTKYHPTTELATHALKEAAVTAGTIENVYNVASEGLGIQNTFKTDNIKDEINKVQSYRIKTENGKPLDIKNTSGNDFEISANSITRYRVYIWLEGQDVDCINIASLGGGIEIDLGLTKDDEIGDVIAEIDNRVSYSTKEITTEPVIATITMEEVIAELPNGWVYTDGTKLAIKKEYSCNVLEQVELKDESGKIIRIEINIDNIDTLVSKVSNTKSTNYGLYTNYPVDIDGDSTNNDWKIFYADDANVFLIADDYVPSEKIGSTNLTAAGLSTTGTYVVSWSTATLTALNHTISENNKYMISKASTFTSTNRNLQAVGSLLETSNWTNFVNTTYATDAIGGSTLEMWVDSWNTVYNEVDYPNEQIYCNNSNENGYYVGNSNKPTTTKFYVNTWAGYTETDYKSELYYPHKEVYGESNGYWLAAPSAEEPERIYSVYYHGNLFSSWYNNTTGSLRPVVSLKSNIEGEKNENVWQLISN